MSTVENIENKSAKPDEKRFRTTGEKAFDWLVYGGIGWVVNTFVSAYMTFKVQDSKWGIATRDSLDRAFKAISKHEHVPGKPGSMASTIFNTFILSGGGTLLVIPIRACEAFKDNIVRWFDKRMKNEGKTQEQLEQAYQAMNQAPKQSAESLLESRALVLLTGLGITTTLGKPMNYLGNALGRGMAKMLTSETKPKWAGFNRKTIHDVSSLMLLDLLIGAFTSVLFYVSSRFFARHIETRKEDRILAKEYRQEHGIQMEKPSTTLAPQKEESFSEQAPPTKVNSIERAEGPLMAAQQPGIQMA